MSQPFVLLFHSPRRYRHALASFVTQISSCAAVIRHAARLPQPVSFVQQNDADVHIRHFFYVFVRVAFEKPLLVVADRHGEVGSDREGRFAGVAVHAAVDVNADHKSARCVDGLDGFCRLAPDLAAKARPEYAVDNDVVGGQVGLLVKIADRDSGGACDFAVVAAVLRKFVGNLEYGRIDSRVFQDPGKRVAVAAVVSAAREDRDALSRPAVVSAVDPVGRAVSLLHFLRL